MTLRNTRRTGIVGLAVAGLLFAGVGTAQAETGLASGSVGTVDAIYNGALVMAGPIAPCDTEGTTNAQTAGRKKLGFYEFGPGTSKCTVNPTTGVAKAVVKDSLFRLDALRPLGGPRIRLTGYQIKCTTTANGSSASWSATGLSGISVPPSIPPNHVVTIPGRTAGAPPMAKVTFNETVTPDPPDGSLTVNIMHIRLFPNGGSTQLGGDIIVGSVYCSPY
jgi:hypothetical protein